MPKSCSKKPKSFTLQRQGKGNEEKTYIQVALELTLVKEIGLFFKVHRVKLWISPHTQWLIFKKILHKVLETNLNFRYQ